ncbi:MAG: GAF domain-containing protein, partial [Chloroflexi bacterium]|nr:GAF domain-containing protein [Chloroflexota bacterium]
MPDVPSTALDRARSDIAGVRRGLTDLAQWLTQQTGSPRAEEISQRVADLDAYLERLTAVFDLQEKERTQLEGLFQVSRAVNSTLNLENVLNRTMDTIIQVTHAERGFLMLADENGELSFRVARNMDRSTIAGPEFEVSRTILREVAQRGEPVVTTDARRDPRFSDQDSVVSLSLRSIL